MRTSVLGVLRMSDTALTAYDILRWLQSDQPNLAPQTIYRALNGLIERGVVHRLESLNAYTICRHAGHPHEAILSICQDCGAVEERVSGELVSALSGVVAQGGFRTSRHVIEIHGRCAACQHGTERR